jgi:hypothetical protein
MRSDAEEIDFSRGATWVDAQEGAFARKKFSSTARHFISTASQRASR